MSDVELTDAELARLRGVLHEFKSRVCDDGCSDGLYAAVESIVAARLSAAEDERLRLTCPACAKTFSMPDLDALRAELAAANALCRELEREIDDRDKAHEGIVATITAAARKDTRTAKSDAAKVQMLSQRLDDMKLSRDKHRNRADTLAARCAELEAEVEGYSYWPMVQKNAALQARLDRVTALADQWENASSWIGVGGESEMYGQACDEHVEELRAALADSGTTAKGHDA